MKTTVLALFAGLVLAPSVGLAADGSAGGQDWRDAWRKARNAMIDSKKDLAFDPTSVIVAFEADADPKAIEVVKLAAGLEIDPIETWAILPGVQHLRVIDGTIKRGDKRPEKTTLWTPEMAAELRKLQ